MQTSATRNKDIMHRVAQMLSKERTTATNIESVVDRAGLDRSEVIAGFGSMHSLVLDMVSELSEASIQPLEQAEDQPVRDVLIEFGHRFINICSDSHLIALNRIALTEVIRHSDIGAAFFDRGPGKISMRLTQYLEYSASRLKHLRIDNAKCVAEGFLSLLRDIVDSSNVVTITGNPVGNDDSAVVSEALSLLCHGILMEG